MSATLTSWDPFAELGELRSRFDRLFDDAVVGREAHWTPAIDVAREDGNLVVRADIPGIAPEEVRIEVDHDLLTMRGEREVHKQGTDRHFVRRERRHGAFARSLALPPGVDASRITAKTHDGMLEVTIPLPEEGKQEPVSITPMAV